MEIMGVGLQGVILNKDILKRPLKIGYLNKVRE